MNVFQPGANCLVGIGVRRLPALNEVGRIEHGLKVCIVAALQQIDTASDGITVDVFLVLMEQDHARRAPVQSFHAAVSSPRRGTQQDPQHRCHRCPL
jgi:hypothetical protein